MHSNPSLKKVLKPVHLWALAVGLVISGEYFGWNLGWDVAGTGGFLIATLLVTIFYITFIFSFTELTAAIPQAGGPFAYAYKAFGPLGGLIAGYATLVEFLLAPPAVAFALGSYVHFLHPALPVLPVAIGCYVVFTLINFLGIRESAMFSLIVTLLAVAELLLFMGIVAPAFRWENFKQDPMPFGWSGVFAALPFAIWFYLAIEGVAMVAEEVKDPQRTIPRGYIYGIVTLVLLALGVMFFTGGVTNWHNLARIDYPLPEAISIVLGKQNSWTKIFAGIGLFGLVASFHGIIISYSRQLYAMARSGYLPEVLARVNTRFQTPHIALIAGGGIGIVALCIGNTGEVITLSALGAVVMYIISMMSLLVLRRKQPNMERPFKVPLYPWFPLTALILAVVCLIAIIWYNPWLSTIFFGLGGLLVILFMAFRKPVHSS
ncbi:ethanolamine permease [Niastella caeni]|uniref:Ethanolamine permease n=1 Tax=Niastella caeni TaxID=2569763 RepID=A0A4S8HY37_9BACT|nr:ethanolamine permease [Niastella caeni]THU40663.1 ethanolamine permease [Niastella caeni]